MKYHYCLDSNFFIESWNVYYSPDVFIDFWDKLKDMAENKICYITQEVFEELVSGDNNKEDLLKEYIKNNKKIFVYEYNEEIEIIFIGLIEDPDIVKLLDNKNNKNGADVLILAYAKYFDSTVVTRDSALINICKKYNIRYLLPHKFIKKNNIKFIIQK
ncbi:DUF4411 family protein [Brachyspira intermedia]|uniref:DUF4411 family protein n=1 Tax=Brachyspira intermedia TaxID=84377 RepID=UPI0030059A98